MSDQDPGPGVSWERTMEILQQKYDNVEHRPSGGDVFLDIPVRDSKQVKRVGLTWQQAKFLALNPQREKDLLNEKFPSDWPSR